MIHAFHSSHLVVVVVEDLIPRLWSYKIRTCYE